MAQKPRLGIYFSRDFINIVEEKAGKVSNFAKVPLSFDTANLGLSQTVTDEVKISTAIKDALVNNNISSRSAVVAVLSKDLIIRFFEIPLVSRGEIEPTVKFESKKYIPFKLEELVFDFQYNIDRATKRIKVLFIAARRDVIDKYISVSEQAGINILSIEPAFLSTLRMLKLTKKIELKTPVAIVDIDMEKGSGDITVVENFYPRFSRDVNLKLQIDKEVVSRDALLARLTNEIRVSLDYCRRQFAAEALNISKIIILINGEINEAIEVLNKELELPVIPVNILESIEPMEKSFDPELITAYGASLKDAVSFPLKVNLFSKPPAEELIKEELGLEAIRKIGEQIDIGFLVKNILAASGVIFLVYIFYLGQINIYKNKLNAAIGARRSTSSLFASMGYAELKSLEEEYARKNSLISAMSKDRIYLTSLLSTMAALKEDGLWVTNLTFSDTEAGRKLLFGGAVYLGSGEEEFSAVHRFLAKLKKSEEFAEFKNISLGTISSNAVGEYQVSNFDFTCN